MAAWVSDSFGLHLRYAVGDYSRDTEETETDLIGVQVTSPKPTRNGDCIQVGLGEVLTAPRFPMFHR